MEDMANIVISNKYSLHSTGRGAILKKKRIQLTMLLKGSCNFFQLERRNERRELLKQGTYCA
jgi:hypothetical protein